jgi:cysteine synthase
MFGIDGYAAAGRGARSSRASRSLDALLVDETIGMPRAVAAFADASRRTLPVVSIGLDATAQATLTRLLRDSRVIAGISSGATLFCLERMAWDHGLRLAGRNQLRSSALADASLDDVAAFLAGANPSGAVAGAAKLVREYRPSRADGTLHAWVLRKSRREV